MTAPTRIIRMIALAGALAIAGCATPPTDDPAPSGPTTPIAADAEAAFDALERDFDARLGVHAIDTGSGETVSYRSGERFAFASTYKALAAAAVLDAASEAELEEVVEYAATDLVTYSPVTEERVETGMTLRELGEAAVRTSDNTAGNLLVAQLGGPTALGTALRPLGDEVSSFDRIETALNDTAPGDPRDTTTPETFTQNLERYLVGDALDEADRELLTTWMLGNATGDALIRAGLPDGWTVADKSGAAAYGTRNDIGVVYPPDADPIVLVVFSDRDSADAEYDDTLVAEATRVVVDALG